MRYGLIWASIVWVILSLVARWAKERSDRTLIVRERNEHRQEEGEKVAEITKKPIKTKDKQDEEDELQRRNLQENNQSEKNA